MKFLIVVDMQNDFINGALANEDAQKIVTDVAKYVEDWDGVTIFTRDTHDSDYLDTYEGKHLPVPHCIRGTDGWQVNKELVNAVSGKDNVFAFDKPTFGYANRLANMIRDFNTYPTTIEFVGVCTDICVISNVLGMKEQFPEVKIVVHEGMCAGLTKEKHNAAIEVMKSCQVEIV